MSELRESRTSKHLAGKKLLGKSVKKVWASGEKARVIEFVDGTKKAYTRSEYMELYNKTMASEQAVRMRKSRRSNEDGTVSMTIGGTKKGKRKVYVNLSAAEKALKRRYGL